MAAAKKPKTKNPPQTADEKAAKAALYQSQQLGAVSNAARTAAISKGAYRAPKLRAAGTDLMRYDIGAYKDDPGLYTRGGNTPPPRPHHQPPPPKGKPKPPHSPKPKPKPHKTNPHKGGPPSGFQNAGDTTARSNAYASRQRILAKQKADQAAADARKAAARRKKEQQREHTSTRSGKVTAS